ncbi:helix-turn-helix domain-containing protein [Rhodanobacter sp. MP1X3]|uniref:winged helix-turn-helix domain-containing protein n=1 Tax=Rhodanobacter sp. MP1X3 TaxID=2723086 RepID=UPI001611827B|nr:helix-turn-helix domain-containing protein [Rhodanobacter sp. MP1X3]MBB6244149.1 DNA-binding transcriptional ArsR family regulator [Rhodanobacter sp. MP1X3]
MAQSKQIRGTVEDVDQIAMLASPTRMEIVMTLEALASPTTVAELAAEMGRPADGLYYHLRALVSSGLLEEHTEAGDQRFQSTTPRGQRVRLRYKLGESGNAKAVRRVAAGMLRMAERDFIRASNQHDTIVEGPRRELWVARLKGWVSATDVAEINRLLVSLAKILDRPRPARARKLIALTWLLAPLDVKPAKRSAHAPKAN